MITDGRFVGNGGFGDEGLGLGVDVDITCRWCGEDAANDDATGCGGGSGGGGDG